MKNILDRIIDGLYTVEKKLSKTESIAIRTTQNGA